MIKKTLHLTLLSLAIAMTACVSNNAANTSALGKKEIIYISGSFGYRERIALLPGAKADVTLSDVSRADAPSIELARQDINLDGKSVPINYELSVSPQHLLDGMSYAVRAEIRGRNGALLWTTDQAHLIDVTEGSQTMEPFMLVKIPSRDTVKPRDALYGTWNVHSVDEYPVVEKNTPKIQFSDGGKVSGATGCNRFTGNYKIQGNILKFGPLAMTKRACVPNLNDQERFFTAILNEVDSFAFNEVGQLVLIAPNGRFLKANEK